MSPEHQVVWQITGHCGPGCKPVGALPGAAPTEPSYCVPACQSCGVASDESVPPAHCTECGWLWSGTFGCQRKHKVPPPGQI